MDIAVDWKVTGWEIDGMGVGAGVGVAVGVGVCICP